MEKSRALVSNSPCGVESKIGEGNTYIVLSRFLIHRVELKALKMLKDLRLD